MNRHRAIGSMKLINGTIKETVGRVLGLAHLEESGKAERSEGKAQIKIGRYWESRAKQR
ncbi:CsbD family protein [Prosthecodimorpha staleyi]|uniref:CsbD family protein n=1 Tax=Prosthecodimorpha staleyi TaxID=2840188 RepID=A0A947GGR2_9HYPH|nr:CsbD family protein [Prosthecodimorpha staleyi]MBT9292685.1 CsbD family protein [Prosthecodimorpha staleyi]